jgi:cytidine deaminase
MHPPTAQQLARLEEAARLAAQRSYSPYSGFAVGAALLTASGTIIAGCNVENACYNLSICAERSAIARAVAKGHRYFTALVIYTPTDTPTLPCGACLQMLSEFGPNLRIYALCDETRRTETTLKALLPYPFQLMDPVRHHD